MDNHICQICQTEVKERKHFWKEHRIKEADYYQKYFPRLCKFSGELLPFKNPESYFENDFKDKRAMVAWFKANPYDVFEYATDLLEKRKERKNLIYAPSQVELRSVMMPSKIWYKEHCFYNDICKGMGLKIRFDLEDEIPVIKDLKNESLIIVDSREQRPLKFGDFLIKVQGLKFGDYALEPNRFKVHIERKNLSDFAGTFGVGFERFKREVTRAKREKAYLIILVESNINDALHFNFLPQMKYSKVNPDYIFHNVRDLMQEFENIQFVFCDGRKKAAEVIKKIFGMTRHPKHYDLQYLMDKKEL